MHHVAIMKPQWRFIEKMLAGTKTIETRWYVHKRPPWGRVGVGDVIYFKNAGQPVSARAVVRRVAEYDNLTPALVAELLARHERDIGIPPKDLLAFYQHVRQKRYALFIWLDAVEPVAPFAITKRGFGAMAAWLTTESVDNLRLNDTPGA